MTRMVRTGESKIEMTKDAVDVWMKGLSTFAVAVGTVIVLFIFVHNILPSLVLRY